MANLTLEWEIPVIMFLPVYLEDPSYLILSNLREILLHTGNILGITVREYMYQYQWFRNNEYNILS